MGFCVARRSTWRPLLRPQRNRYLQILLLKKNHHYLGRATTFERYQYFIILDYKEEGIPEGGTSERADRGYLFIDKIIYLIVESIKHV